MASTTTQLTIANRALQHLGYQPISSLQETVLLSTLRENLWNFAIARTVLAASATPPAFGKANYFPLPGDFVDLAPPDETFNFNWTDWQIEGQQIASDDQGPLHVRYITSNITESMFDVSFAEAFAAKLAMEICEELTQSNTKMQTAQKAYDDSINQARRRNAFESRPVKPAEDSWITKRF
jgi:hypothetical protein